ncbi:MAG: NAD(+)/NADH kinase [Planctomycetota bacterium]|nr:NAD(+)/NADH kinase [Planctomycetota bacterium]
MARRASKASPSKGRSFGRVLVLADGDKVAVDELLDHMDPWLRERATSVNVERDLYAYDEQSPAARKKRERPDLVVVLGGDGAILAAVRAFHETPVPTIGINFGRVGFLASVEASQWREALEEVQRGRAIVEKRMRLAVELHGAKTVTAVALNDAVVTRGAFQGMLSIALKVGGHWVTNYRADGLVVATPSGSTAYSMAAGGPILAPSMQAFSVSPVSPQALSHRPLVVDGAETLELHVTRASGLTTLVVDGQGFFPMHEGDFVRVKRHPVPYPLLSRPGFDPYTRLRERLGWRGSIEPDVFPDDDQPPKRREVDPGHGGVL